MLRPALLKSATPLASLTAVRVPFRLAAPPETATRTAAPGTTFENESLTVTLGSVLKLASAVQAPPQPGCWVKLEVAVEGPPALTVKLPVLRVATPLELLRHGLSPPDGQT